MNRSEILAVALECITKDRNTDYGEPENSFADTAEFWTTYLGFKIEPHQVAHMLALLKVVRAKTSPHKMDNMIDLAGYAACAGEISPKKENVND